MSQETFYGTRDLREMRKEACVFYSICFTHPEIWAQVVLKSFVKDHQGGEEASGLLNPGLLQFPLRNADSWSRISANQEEKEEDS